MPFGATNATPADERMHDFATRLQMGWNPSQADFCPACGKKMRERQRATGAHQRCLDRAQQLITITQGQK